MLVLGPFDAEKYANLQINCISRFLSPLSISLLLFFTPICQKFALRVASFEGAAFFYIWDPCCLYLRICCKRVAPVAIAYL